MITLALRRSLTAVWVGSVRRLAGPFSVGTVPASTSRRVSVSVARRVLLPVVALIFD
ncbi:hypothetical protein BH18CHL1_BH18CHL1_07330 [soil metagenome]